MTDENREIPIIFYRFWLSYTWVEPRVTENNTCTCTRNTHGSECEWSWRKKYFGSYTNDFESLLLTLIFIVGTVQKEKRNWH